MQIDCLDPMGINRFEQLANEVLSKKLPDSWKGYSSLEMVGRQSSEFEADLVLITHDRIIIVELKNYSGKLFSNNGKWVQEYSDGRQEYRKNGVKQARRSAQILSSKLDSKLKGKFRPWIDFCVVLCGSADEKNLPSDEKDYVFTLDTFKEIGEPSVYTRLFSTKTRIPRKEDAPYKNIKLWDRIFSNNSADFRAKRFSVNNYEQKGGSIFQHKDGLYAEFKSERIDNHNYKALMRRWDFTAPTIIENTRTPEQRTIIAHRESSVLGYIDNQDEDLKNSHLALLYLPTDLSSDFVELYEWPQNKDRLDVFVRKNQKRLTIQNRLDIIQSLVSQLARLHDIDVAHRDIGSHSVWVSLPSKVVLSNFLTATYPDPENKTVQNVRKILQHGRIKTPEELFEDSSGTVFTRDVYLTIAACHYIAFNSWPKKQEGIFVWEEIPNNPIAEKLGSWFAKGLELESKSRFQDLREALTELNQLITPNESSDVNQLKEISRFHSTKNIYADFGAISVKIQGLFHLLQSPDNKFGIKAWFGVSEILSSGGMNYQLISFLKRLELLQSCGFSCLQEIIEFGFNPQMQNVYFQFKWVEGDTWQDVVESIEQEPALHLIKNLLESVLKIHSHNIIHGDLQPTNLVVSNGEVTFIDLVEYSTQEDPNYTPDYVPPNFESLPKVSIDRYGTIKIIYELAQKCDLNHLAKYTSNMLNLPEISLSELEKLNDDFDNIVNPKPPVILKEYTLGHRNLGSLCGVLLSDDSIYHIGLRLNQGKAEDLLEIKITTPKNQLKLLINEETKSIVSARQFSIRHDQFIRNKNYADIEFKGIITISDNFTDESKRFIDSILEHPVYQKLKETSLDRDKKKKEVSSHTASQRKILSLKKPEIIDAKEIWEVMVETEHESNPRIQVVTEPKVISDGVYNFRFSTETNDLDFNLDTERVSLKMDIGGGEYREIGQLIDIGTNILSYKPKGRVTPQAGDTIMAEGSLTASSLEKRKRAVKNLINGRSVIPNITDYFSLGVSISPLINSEPTDEELDLYTEYDENGNITFSLNELQRKAFKNLYKHNPLVLLQGPPGTGKTSFIGSFIHYSISKGARRILLVSQSHEAVNNAAEKVRSLFEKNDREVDVVRLGDQGHLSLALNDVGEKSLQDHYRDKFRAEYKERITALFGLLGVPQEFTNFIVNYESSFGRKIERLASLLKDEEQSQNEELLSRVCNLLDKLSEFIERETGLGLNLNQEQLGGLRDFIYKVVAVQFNVYSEDLLFKLKNIISISNEWLSVMSSSHAQFQNFLAKTKTLVCGTCVGIGRYHYGIQENIYDLVVIDEAARSPASELAIAMQVGRKVLLVGDHKQLPPLFDDLHIKAASRLLPEITHKELKRSDFERAFTSEYGQTVGQSLLVQYRMSPPIGNLVSSCFYNNKLQTGRSATSSEHYKILEGWGAPVTWVDTSCKNKDSYESRPDFKGANINSFINEYEANVIITIINRLYEQDADETVLTEDGDPKIGVICMYSEQARLIVKKINTLSWARNLLEKQILKIDTVDGYQGKENDFIILSLVRSNANGTQGYVSSEERANVSLSRAKEALFIVGNKDMWHSKNQDSAFGKVFNFIYTKISEQPVAVIKSVNDYQILSSSNLE